MREVFRADIKISEKVKILEELILEIMSLHLYWYMQLNVFVLIFRSWPLLSGFSLLLHVLYRSIGAEPARR